MWEDLCIWFERFMKLPKVRIHYHEIEACHMTSWFRRIMSTNFRRFMKLVEHCSNIGGKVHELAWNLHDIVFVLMWSHLTKRSMYDVQAITTNMVQSGDVKALGVQSEDSLTSFNWSHRSSQSCPLLTVNWCLCSQQLIQYHYNTSCTYPILWPKT